MFVPAHQSPFDLTIEGVENDFQVSAFTGHEAISQPFAFDVQLVSENPGLDLETLLHKPAFLQMAPDGSGIHGLIYRAAQGDSGNRLTHYSVTLRPLLSYLAHSTQQRIFQNLSVPEIIGQVLEQRAIFSNGYTFNVGANYPKRVYCVQYDESDLHFVQRLCEEEGIHYHFQHSKTEHLLVFGDDFRVFPKLAPVPYKQPTGMVADGPVIQGFNLRVETRPTCTTRRDYRYDPLDRLIEVRSALPERFAHDPAGNLLGHTNLPVADLANVKGNRVRLQGDRHYDYDAYGNLIRERRGTGQQLVTVYRYDCQHRMIGVTLPDGSTASYHYDAFGRRIKKTVDGQTTEFLWQGERLTVESAKNRYRTYLYEPGTFRPLAMLDGEGPTQATPLYYHLDHLGTPQELTNYSGEILWSASYRAYGSLAALDVEKIDNPLRFQGQYHDDETGLHYNRHRYHNPGTGRYLTPDPIRLAGGLNAYQYVPNPTGWVDPLGLSGCPGKQSNRTASPTDRAQENNGEPSVPAPVIHTEKTVRVRHYTNRKGSSGIQNDGVIRAKDNNRVYVEPASKKTSAHATLKRNMKCSRGEGWTILKLMLRSRD